jgi:hypothetical protein
MVPSINPVIRLDMPTGTSLADMMNEIRTWLDARRIEPSLFKMINTTEGAVALEIGFSSNDLAIIFQREFAESLPT